MSALPPEADMVQHVGSVPTRHPKLLRPHSGTVLEFNHGDECNTVHLSGFFSPFQNLNSLNDTNS